MNIASAARAEKSTPSHAPILYSPYRFGNKAVSQNRFFKSAMSEVLAKQGEFLPTEEHYTVYRRWAAGGTGIIMSGNVMIDRNALGEPGNVVLEDDKHLARFKDWVVAVKEGNPEALFWMQINHPGKQSPKFLTPEPVAPSAISLGKGLESNFVKPRELSGDEIHEIINRFATTARLAKEAGFDGVQIHGAHGYLVSQFLSPHHNRREDEWGGSPENRRRFALEIYRAIRKAVGEAFPIAIKMNSADFQKGGFGGEEAFELIEALSEEGIDLIEISGGNYESPAMTGARQSTVDREGYFLDFASEARARTKAPIAVTGGFRSVAAMEGALASDATDFIGIARPLTFDPELPKNAAGDADYAIDVGKPGTGVRSLDMMFMIPITYYETQIRRIANGKNPDPNMSAWRTVWDNVVALGGAAFKKRRG